MSASLKYQRHSAISQFYAHTRLTALCPGLPGWAGTRKIKPIWILLKQETVSGSGISWAICKSAPSFRQITMPTPHHSVFYRPDALPMPPNQQRQSTEGTGFFASELKSCTYYTERNVMLFPMVPEEVFLHHKSVTYEANFVILSLMLSERISA